ncbi:MAG: hypothetical protein JOS17DRAFT_767286, partial [Linnemannia elongata]
LEIRTHIYKEASKNKKSKRGAEISTNALPFYHFIIFFSFLSRQRLSPFRYFTSLFHILFFLRFITRSLTSSRSQRH